MLPQGSAGGERMAIEMRQELPGLTREQAGPSLCR